MGACIDSFPNFNDQSSIFQILCKMEEENKKLKQIADKSIDDPNLSKKCLNKTESILNFLKNKPLYYVEERLGKFKLLLTNFYMYTYRYDIENYKRAEEELQEFILNMMDYYNGIRVTIAEKKNLNSNINLSNNEVYQYNHSIPDVDDEAEAEEEGNFEKDFQDDEEESKRRFHEKDEK